MTDKHLITPPDELMDQWATAALGAEDWLGGYNLELIATAAAQWGADQELEACCEWAKDNLDSYWARVSLRAARRPKPPSLKEQALEELDELLAAVKQLGIFNPPKNIRRALEALPND